MTVSENYVKTFYTLILFTSMLTIANVIYAWLHVDDDEIEDPPTFFMVVTIILLILYISIVFSVFGIQFMGEHMMSVLGEKSFVFLLWVFSGIGIAGTRIYTGGDISYTARNSLNTAIVFHGVSLVLILNTLQYSSRLSDVLQSETPLYLNVDRSKQFIDDKTINTPWTTDIIRETIYEQYEEESIKRPKHTKDSPIHEHKELPFVKPH